MAVTDFAGKVKERIEYSSYGRITQRTGSTTDTPFLFGGEAGVETDANGLYYMHARYYNPHLRRFINSDPAGLAGGMNFYAYADGDPISMIDPSGLGATSADRNDQIRNDFMSAYNQQQAETAAAYKFTGYAGVKPEPVSGRQMVDFALSFTPGGEAVKALYTSSTGRELGTGAWSQRSDGAVLMQGLVGAATLAPVFPAAGKALGAVKAPSQPLSLVGKPVTELHRPYLRKGLRDIVDANGKTPDGKWIDGNTGEIFEGAKHYGHKYGLEHRRLLKEAQSKRMTQKQFNEWINSHPEWFQIEKPANNLSHKFEKPGS